MQFCLTNIGKTCLARVNAGEMALHLTRAVTGAGISDSVETLIGVIGEKQQIQLDEVRAEGEYTHILCVLTNLEWREEYILHQLGLYAADGEGGEVLAVIGQDLHGERIPSIEEKEVEYQFHIGMRVSNAAEVTFDFSVDDFVRKKYFYEHLEEADRRFKALPRVRVGPRELLDRKDTLLLETLAGTDRVTQIRERDAQDEEHRYDLAVVFRMAEHRSGLVSGETLGTLFGQIQRYLYDLKPNVYREADDPFTLMREATYIPPARRTKGSLYGLVTRSRGVIVVQYDRYVQGLEQPRQKRTLYGVETRSRATAVVAAHPYIGVMRCMVTLEEGDTTAREPETLYGIIKRTQGG